MSSLELVNIINEVRALNGRTKVQHGNLLKKIEAHPGIQPSKFLLGYTDEQGKSRKCYNLPKRECDLLVMSESLFIQAQVYDRLSEEMQKRSTRQIEERHSADAELGAALKKAIRMEDYDNASELDKTLDKLDFLPAARAHGVSVDVLRRQVASHTAATLMLAQLQRGEHQHESPVKDVIQWGRSSVREEDARAKMLENRRVKALTLDQLATQEMIHKHDRKG